MANLRILIKLFLSCILATLLSLVVYFAATQETFPVETFEPFDPDVPSPALQNSVPTTDLLKYKLPVRGEDNIIFLESVCVTNTYFYDSFQSKIVLSFQQVCAIESAAKVHPNTSVYLFYSCAMDLGSVNRSSEVVRQLFQYPNVHIWHQSMESLFEGTPLEQFYRSGQMKRSNWPIPHSSDVLRILLLWKYGGTYLDLDFLVMRSFNSLGPNFAGIEGSDFINNAALRLSVHDFGLDILDECVEELRTNFNGKIWGHNGPLLLTRVIRRRCGGITDLSKMTLEACKGFLVLPQQAFYSILYAWRKFFDEEHSESILAEVKDGYALHLWHSLMMYEGGDTIRPGSRQPIALLEREYCPVVHALTQVGPYILAEASGGRRTTCAYSLVHWITLISGWCFLALLVLQN